MKNLIIKYVGLSLLMCSLVSLAQNKGPVEPGLLIKVVGGANFAPLGPSESVSSLDGCYQNQEDAFQTSGDMYAGVDMPPGTTIEGISAHVFDVGVAQDQYSQLVLRRRNANGEIATLATITSDVFGFFEEYVDIEPSYIVEENDFFDLLFTAEGRPIFNAYYICGVEIFYSANLR